ncbi:MAG: hypothetical protein ACE5JV_01155 [Nitrososphaerales archaeon]
MSSIERVADEVKRLTERLQAEGVPLQVRADNESGIIKIYGEGSDVLKRAVAGLQEVSELAYTTAEHHPYWGVVYHAGEISRILLEKWNDDLSNDELGEIEWRTEEIKGALERLKQTHGEH